MLQSTNPTNAAFIHTGLTTRYQKESF